MDLNGQPGHVGVGRRRVLGWRRWRRFPPRREQADHPDQSMIAGTTACSQRSKRPGRPTPPPGNVTCVTDSGGCGAREHGIPGDQRPRWVSWTDVQNDFRRWWGRGGRPYRWRGSPLFIWGFLPEARSDSPDTASVRRARCWRSEARHTGQASSARTLVLAWARLGTGVTGRGGARTDRASVRRGRDPEDLPVGARGSARRVVGGAVAVGVPRSPRRSRTDAVALPRVVPGTSMRRPTLICGAVGATTPEVPQLSA